MPKNHSQYEYWGKQLNVSPGANMEGFLLTKWGMSSDKGQNGAQEKNTIFSKSM